MADRVTGANLPAYLEATGWSCLRHLLGAVYNKDGRSIWWGLHEYGRQPTLIGPRPSIEPHSVPDGICIFDYSDNTINRWLMDTPAEDVVTALFDPNFTIPSQYSTDGKD